MGTGLFWAITQQVMVIPRSKVIFCPALYDILKNENCSLLGYYAASIGNSVPTFGDNLSVRSSRVKNPRRLTPEDGTDKLSRNVGTELPIQAA